MKKHLSYLAIAGVSLLPATSFADPPIKNTNSNRHASANFHANDGFTNHVSIDEQDSQGKNTPKVAHANYQGFDNGNHVFAQKQLNEGEYTFGSGANGKGTLASLTVQFENGPLVDVSWQGMSPGAGGFNSGITNTSKGVTHHTTSVPAGVFDDRAREIKQIDHHENRDNAVFKGTVGGQEITQGFGNIGKNRSKSMEIIKR